MFNNFVKGFHNTVLTERLVANVGTNVKAQFDGQIAQMFVRTAGKNNVMAERKGKKSVAKKRNRRNLKNLPWPGREYMFNDFLKGYP